MERDTFAGALQRRWWVVVVAAVLGFLAGAVPQPKTTAASVSGYTATHVLQLSSTDPTGVISSDTISISQLTAFATAGDVPKMVAADLNDGSKATDLAAQVSVTVDTTSNLVSVQTTQDSAERAMRVANAFAKALSTFVATRQDDLREQRLAAAQVRLDAFAKKIEEYNRAAIADPSDPLLKAKLDAAQRRYSITFEQYDALSDQPNTISLDTWQSADDARAIRNAGGLQAPGSRRSRGLFGMFAGAALGLGAVLVLNLFDRRIRQRAQAEAILGVPVQLTIPVARKASDRGVAVLRHRHDRLSDSYRAMRSVLALAHHELADSGRAPVTLVLSSGPADGKTTASANIAASFTEAGSRTLAINTDFRRPNLSRLLQVPTDPEKGGVIRPSTIVKGLHVHDARLVDKESTPGDLARRVVHDLPQLANEYDEIVIDSPPVALAAEVLELLPSADTIIVMVRLGHTRIDAAAKTAETLRALGITNYLLAVIGGATDRVRYYGYGYGYTRGYVQAPARRRPTPEPEPAEMY